MLDIMMMSKNAIQTYNTRLRTTAANLANLDVAGYKRIDVSFQSVFERVVRSGTTASPINESGGTNPIQLGSGVSIGDVSLDFSQGYFQEGSNIDLAIQGNGLFIVSPDNGETMRYTRAGQFQVNANANLVTRNGGAPVYGLNSAGNLTPIDLSGFTNAQISNMSFDENGQLWVYTHSNWSSTPQPTKVSYTGYTIALTSFNNLSGLQQAAGTTFSETSASGSALDAAAPGTTYGIISPRNYEQSNVFLTSETIDSMAAQQALNGNLAVIKTINDEISNFINKLG